MNPNSVLLLLIAIAGLGLAAAGLFMRRSIIFGVVSIVVALAAGLGAWYSWAESAAIGWALGYALIAALAGISAVRHFAARTV